MMWDAATRLYLVSQAEPRPLAHSARANRGPVDGSRDRRDSKMLSNEFWVIHQGREVFVVESKTVPDTRTKRGERTKEILSSWPTKATADGWAAQWAEDNQNTVRK